MASLYYEINKNNAYIPVSTNYIYYNVSYDENSNQTKITFDPTLHKIWRNTEVVSKVTTTVTVVATDNGEEIKQASLSFTAPKVSDTNSRQFFSPTPSPNELIIQHSSKAGKKYIQITASTSIIAGRYGGSGSGSVEVESGEYSYGRVSVPFDCSLSYEEPSIINPNEIYRDTILKLSWTAANDGDHNPVLGYRIYYGLSDQGYTQSLDIDNIQEYSFKIMNNFGGPTKGVTFQLGIQTKATYGELHSEIVPLGILTIINKPPEQPKVNTKGIIRITGNVNTEIQVVIATDNKYSADADEDEVTYFYTVSENSEYVDENTEKELPSNKIILMNQDQPYLYIRAKETKTLQDLNPITGNWTCVLVTVNEAPEIIINFQADQETTSANNSSIKYINKFGNISCNLSNTPGTTNSTNSFEWLIGNSSNYITIISQGPGGNNSQNIINNIFIEPALNSFGGGQPIEIKLTIKDGAGDIFNQEITTEYHRLYKVTPASLKILPIEELSALVSERFINNLVNATVEVDFPVNDVARTIQFQLGQRNEENEWVYTQISSELTALPVDIQNYGPFITNIQKDREYRFQVIMGDEFGNKTYYIDENKSYWKLPLFDVSGFSFTQKEWHPLKDYQDQTNLEVLFTASYIDNIGEIGKNSYTIQAECNGKIYDLANRVEYENSQDWTTEISGATINFKISNIELFKKLKTATNVSQISIIYKITGYNAFGVPGSSVTYNGTIITQEAPSVSELSIAANIKSNASEGFETWFNSEDEIELILTGTPFDYNDLLISENGEFIEQKTITNYILLYKYSETEEWKRPQATWQGWQGNFIKDGQYLTSIILNSMPALSLNGKETDIILGLQLIDNTNLIPLQLNDNSPQILTINLKACRKENIVFSIDSANLTNKELNVILSINDFGGNSKGFDNFKRSGEESFNITLYISLNDEAFTAYEANIPYKEGANSIQVLNKYLNTKLIPYIQLNNGEEENNKLYIKAKLEIITNSFSKNIITATTATYLLYLSQPTMSHRAHWVGINTSNLTSDEVFKVSEYKDQKFIRLIGNYQGVDEHGNLTSPLPVEISIDLKEGTIISTIDEAKGYEINMRTGQIIVGDVTAKDIMATEIIGAKISGGTW